MNWNKVFTVLDSFNQIIITALLLDNRPRLLGQNADLLVTILSDEKLKNVRRKIVLACLSILRAKKQQLIAHINSIFLIPHPAIVFGSIPPSRFIQDVYSDPVLSDL